MLLNPRAFGVAAGLTAAVLFVLCAAAVAVAPEATTAFFGYLIHADLDAFGRTLTWGRFVGGLIAWTIGTGLTFAFAAWLYNRLLPPIASAEANPAARPQSEFQHL